MKNCAPSLVKSFAPLTEIVGMPCARMVPTKNESARKRASMVEAYLQKPELLIC